MIVGMAAAAALVLVLAVTGFAMMTSGERIAPSGFPPPPAKKSGPAGMFVLNAIADRLGSPFAGTAMELLAPWRDRLRRRIDVPSPAERLAHACERIRHDPRSRMRPLMTRTPQNPRPSP